MSNLKPRFTEEFKAQAVRRVRDSGRPLSEVATEMRVSPSLKALTRQFVTTSGVDTRVRIKGKPRRLKPETESVLYRVAYEALVNVERHARATGVVLTFSVTKDQAQLAVRDDGVGIKQRQGTHWQSAASFGLKSMARWMADVGGTLRVSPAYPRGLLIEAVPLEA